MDLKAKIREVPDWPKKGVRFYDITTLLEHRRTLQYVVNEMVRPFLEDNIQKVVAIDARGFVRPPRSLFSSAPAYAWCAKKANCPIKPSRPATTRSMAPTPW